MRHINLVVLASISLLLTAFTINSSIDWQIKDGYSIEFKGKSAKGSFKSATGDISFDEDDLVNSNFAVSVEVASIATGNGLKNKHAKSDNWFDAEKYPLIKFTSSQISKSNSGYQVEGQLEMHGITKTITIPFSFSSNTFSGEFSIMRLDYGIGSSSGLAKKVSNEIKLNIVVPVSKM